MLHKLVLVVCVLATVPCFVSSLYKVKLEKTANGFIVHPIDKNINGLSPRIIGGEEVTPHQYPFQTLLFVTKGTDVYLCGGTLITNRWVLTAAHCLEMQPDEISVILGVHDILNPDFDSVQYMTVYDYEFHSGWNNATYQNDIGLIRLSTNATLNKYVNVVQLANGTDKYVDKEGITLGWGQNETLALSYVLRQVTSKIISNDNCTNTNDNYKKVVKSTHMCTSGEGPKGSCNGDSGGPLLVDGVQVGIVSFGTTNCTLGLPSVFTRVADFRDWIEERVGSLDDGGDDDNNGGDDDNDGGDDNDDGGASTHSLHFVAAATVALCLVRSFGF